MNSEKNKGNCLVLDPHEGLGDHGDHGVHEMKTFSIPMRV